MQDDDLNAALQGDQAAIGRVITRTVQRLRRLWGRYGDGLRDDLRQECMIACLRALQSFDSAKGGSFTTYAAWWCRSRIDHFRDHQRSILSGPRRRERERVNSLYDEGLNLHELIGDPDARDPSDVWESPATTLPADWHDVLSPNQLRVVLLRLDGLSNEEIGERVGSNAKAVSVMLSAAVKRLRLCYS